MKLKYIESQTEAAFLFTDDYILDYPTCPEIPGLFRMFWNTGETSIVVTVDEVPINLAPQQIITITPIQKFCTKGAGKLRAIMFNRDFYCIQDHDDEVSCSGLLFFGSSDIPVISLDEDEQAKFEALYHVFIDELNTKDRVQGEMLRMLLKRIIIKATRLLKTQTLTFPIEDIKLDMIRKYNMLVEQNFREKKQVADYADMLNKSPKTLCNIFLIYNQKTPLQVIHDRIAVEARRMLIYTDKSNKEIAQNLGFDDQAHFSRFFKKVTGLSPSDFKKTPLISA